MQTVLIDTDYAIDFLRGKSAVKQIIIPLWEHNIAFLSLLSVYELYAGMRACEQEETDNFIQACRIEPLTIEIAKKAGEDYRHWRARGITLTAIDCIIAATAKTKKHKVATHNERHYPDPDGSLLLKRLFK